MRVLSLFDGMGCAWIALKELGIRVDRGYSSEVDPYCIRQVSENFPDVHPLGDIRSLDVSGLGRIDLVLGGSPCTDFSLCGRQRGMETVDKEKVLSLENYLRMKEDGVRFVGQSYLFWEYLRVLNDIRKFNPDVKFLLENVPVGKVWRKVIDEAMGVRGIEIDSRFFSAQSRRRVYWTNIRTESGDEIPRPVHDRGLTLRDVLDEEVEERWYLKDSAVETLREYIRRNREAGRGFGNLPCRKDEKMWTVTAGGIGRRDLVIVGAAMRGRDGKGKGCYTQRIETRSDDKSNALTTVTKDTLVLEGERIRRLTPTECARLQTIPCWYRWVVSDTRKRMMVGNGWTVEVIKYILGYLKN